MRQATHHAPESRGTFGKRNVVNYWIVPIASACVHLMEEMQELFAVVFREEHARIVVRAVKSLLLLRSVILFHCRHFRLPGVV
jgi:hypothetical protein